MNKRIHIILFVCMLGLLLPTAVSRALLVIPQPAPAPQTVHIPSGGDPIPQGIGIATSWYSQDTQSIHKGAGIVSYYNLTVFGQNICTDYGDPYSPLNSPWTDEHPYAYEYRIRIPADYSHDIVRVELFDPDSMNAVNPGTIIISRTNAAIDAGLPATTTGSCTTNRKDYCVLSTGELALVNNGTLTLEQINPYYFWRIDENRGTGSAPGNGMCGQPGSYNATYNTRTLFKLHYWHQNPDGTMMPQDLAYYTGQVGDGARDNGDHDTDRRWVSPGAAQSFDQPVFVPTDSGSPGNFEIDLSSETPDIVVDPETGDRYLYLNVYGLDGASENGYDLWAGPPDYMDTVPSDVNDRNLTALNNPSSHSAQGIEIEALENLLLNNNYPARLDIPLSAIGPEYAGANLNVTLFDADAGSQPPITFVIPPVAQDDWSLVYGMPGVDDPDGVPAGVRCEIGSNCNSQFITPPYTLTLPTETGCDYTDPDPQVCTPFYGGRLTAQYLSGFGDTYLWQITNLTEPPPNDDPSVGCSAFPIAIQEGIYSVNPPGSPLNPYPNLSDFQNPDPPLYSDFIDHVPDVLLSEAQAGYVYRVWNGFDNGNFGWLRWNTGLTTGAVNADNMLAWPGNSRDYTDNGAIGTAVPGYPWPVYGYIEPGDPTDQEMHLADWVADNPGVGDAANVRAVLNEHIDQGRVLRLLVWDTADAPNNYHISRFALFRLHGYNLGQGSGWLLFEFIGWDDSCGQAAEAVTAVTLDGRYDAVAGIEYTFTAVANPTATLPITYVWQADGQTITHTSGLSDSLTFAWESLGLQPITVTAVNDGGSVTDGRIINILPSTDRIPAFYGGNSRLYPQFSGNLALIKTATPSVLGQNICTAFGDAFSPLNSPWTSIHPYYYEYLIQIPGDYPYDTVRVELFDPDSINALADQIFTISRTQAAVTAGLSPTTSASCATDRRSPCMLLTGELPLVDNDTLDYEQINPIWLARVDENFGAGPAPGNGTCGVPPVYNATYNTRTLFRLHYWRQNPDGTIVQQDLASYTGQTGDARDTGGNHDTDIRWVSPGAAQSYDQPVFVPMDAGSPGNFEIDLTSEIPGILTDSVTGDRYLNLGIASLEGSSENVFQIWAGPPNYLSTVPSLGNGRNLSLLDGPGTHNPFGVTVYAPGRMVQNWNLPSDYQDIPFTQVDSVFAGADISLSNFDADSGTLPPITLYADSLPEEEWSWSFGVPGVPDPDGQTRNCQPGSCNDVWVTPPYRVTLPDDFPGGRIMTRFNGGAGDTVTWEMNGWGQAWVSGPITGSTHVTYTFTADASYFLFSGPLTYTWEAEGQAPITHVGGITDEVALSWADGGVKMITVTVQRLHLQRTLYGSHQITITEQLQPDLAVIGQPQLQTPLPLGANLPVSFTVTIENVGDVDVNSQFFVDIFLDPTVVLTTGIPITESDGFTAVPALAAGESRLVTITAQQGFAAEPFTHTVYAMVESLEAIGESDETNNLSAPLLVTDVHPLLAGVTLAGPELGLTGEVYTFTAVVTPSTITDPITYTWLVDSAPPLTQTNGTAVAAPFGWAVPGSYTLTITATHGFNAVSDTHTIVITDTLITDLAVIGTPQLLTPQPVQPQQPVSFTVTIANVGNMPITSSFRTDIFLDPAVVLTDSIPITQSAAFVIVNGLGVGETAVLTFTIPAGFSNGLFERAVYAMVDSTQVITEVDETNNISAPLSLDVFWRLYLPVIRTP